MLRHSKEGPWASYSFQRSQIPPEQPGWGGVLLFPESPMTGFCFGNSGGLRRAHLPPSSSGPFLFLVPGSQVQGGGWRTLGCRDTEGAGCGCFPWLPASLLESTAGFHGPMPASWGDWLRRSVSHQHAALPLNMGPGKEIRGDRCLFAAG